MKYHPLARRLLHSSPLCQSVSDTSRPGDSLNNHPIESSTQKFSHLDNTGKAKMVNVGPKACVKRVALARGEIAIGMNVLDRLLDGSLGTKGDILSVAKLAGIMGAKTTSNLIPMCHQIPLDHVQVNIEPRRMDGSLVVEARVEAEHKTGVEMECMTAVSITLLTIYDMCKSVSHNMVISNVRLVHKSKRDI